MMLDFLLVFQLDLPQKKLDTTCLETDQPCFAAKMAQVLAPIEEATDEKRRRPGVSPNSMVLAKIFFGVLEL